MLVFSIKTSFTNDFWFQKTPNDDDDDDNNDDDDDNKHLAGWTPAGANWS